MNFGQLTEIFHQRALDLTDSKEKNAKFRSASYQRVASKMESEFKSVEKATADKINTLEISDHMKTTAIGFLNGKKIKVTKPLVAKKASVKTKVVKPLEGLSDYGVDNNSTPEDSKSEDSSLLKELTGFMGIGEERAKELIKAGVKNINSLHMKKFHDLLPLETKTFLSLKPIQQIPHENIKILEPYLLKAQTNAIKIQLVGSYRREKPISSDIDMMVISEDESAIEKLLKKISKILNGKIWPYSKGRDKLSMIVDMSELLGVADHTAVYKIDAFRTLPENKIPMLLYSTGSKEFNIFMRGKAKKLGMLLNQKGLFKDGELVPDLDSEESYFEALGIEYKEPKNRI